MTTLPLPIAELLGCKDRAIKILAPFLALFLAGCDKPGPDEAQVLARVNGDEISVHQVNFARSQSPTKVLGESDLNALVERMIDRQLAVQQALALKLDRQPDVMMRLEEARLDILAAAYGAHINAMNPTPQTQDAAAFYAEHPGLFAERKIYRLREISIPADSPTLPEAQARLERKEDLEDVLAWLRQQAGSFTDQQALRPAEQLPVEVAERLNRVKPGQTISFRLPRALVIYHLLGAESAPLALKSAETLIKDYLKKQHESSTFKKELQRLRAIADIARTAPPN